MSNPLLTNTFIFNEPCNGEHDMSKDNIKKEWKVYSHTLDARYKRVFKAVGLNNKLGEHVSMTIAVKLQESAIRRGYRWFGQTTPEVLNMPYEAIVFDSKDKTMSASTNHMDTYIDEGCVGSEGNNIRDIEEWLNENKEQPDYKATERLVLYAMTPALHENIQRVAFLYGYKWGNDEKEVKYQGVPTLIFNNKNTTKYMTYSPDTNYTTPAGVKVIVANTNQYEVAKEWFEAQHGEVCFVVNVEPMKKEEVVMSQPTTNQPSPYDVMVDDIMKRIEQRLPKQQPVDKNQVIEIVNGILSKQGRLQITIEDRRTTPPTVVDSNEPCHRALQEVIGVLKSDCWCAIVGPAGGGKTLGVMQYAKMCGIKIMCIKQMSRMIAPHDLVGFIDANGKYRKGAWTDAIIGYEYPNDGTFPACNEPKDERAIIVIDEMDNSNENIIMLVKALQTGIIAMPYGEQRINPNMQVCATMNTWGTGATREYVGRMAQDAALLNEFQFVEWDYDVEFEWDLLQRTYHKYSGEKTPYKVEHMFGLHAMFKAMRRKAEEQKVRVIISTRNLINVAKMLLNNTDWKIHPVLKKSVYKGLKEEEIKRIEAPEHWSVKGLGKAHSTTTEEATPAKKTERNCPI